MELSKLPIHFESAPLRVLSRAAAEGTLTPPANLPPMVKVLSVDGRATASAEAAEGKLTANGAVTLSVLYLCDAGKLHGFESVALFRHGIDLAQARPDMRCCVQCSVGEISWRLSGGGLELRAEVLLDCAAGGRETLSAVSGISAEGLESRTETLSVWQTELVTEELGLRDEVRLPRAADRLLSVSGFCRIQSALPEEEKVSLSGMLRLCALFAAPDGTVVQAPFSLPFEARIPLPEGTQNTCASARLLALSGTLVDDDILSVEARAEVRIAALSQTQQTVFRDAYLAGQQLNCAYASLSLRRDLWCNCRGTLRLEAALPDGMPDAERVLAARLRPALEHCSAGSGSLAASGTVYASILYLCREGNLHSFDAALPFACDCEAPALTEGMDLVADAACELLHAGAATGSILIQCALDCAVEAGSMTEHTVLSEAVLGEAQGGMYGPVVYFPAEGETLWDVGRRFSVPLAELRALNPSLAEELPPALLLNLRRARMAKNA